MRKNKIQIKWMSWIAAIMFLISILTEFKVLNEAERLIIPHIPFIQGHRDYVTNVAIGICCSTVVVIFGEYLEYKRLDKKIRYEIDFKLKRLKELLNQIDTNMNLLQIREFRNENLQEYKNLCKLEESYSPYESDPKNKEYSEKLILLIYETQLLFWSELEIYINADIKKEHELCELIESQPEDDMGKADWIYKCKLAKKSGEKTKKYHQRDFQNQIKQLVSKIKKFDL